MKRKLNKLILYLIGFVAWNAISGIDVLAQEIILDPPVIDSISVDTLPTGEYRCIVGWEPYDWTGFNTDSSGFIIRDVHPLGGYQNPDTLYDAFLSFYFDSTSNPMEEIQGYGLDAFTYVDGEFIDSEIADQYSQNMQIEVSNYDSCQTAALLTWNTYYGDEAPSSAIEPPYTVYAISANDYRKEMVTTNSYEFSNLNQNETYTFRVRAYAEDFSSTSTPTEYYINKPEFPVSSEFKRLTTSFDYENSLSIDLDAALTGKLIVFKSTELDFGFDTLEIIETTQDVVDVNDEVGSGVVSYYYLETQDLCLEVQIYSDTINSLILSATDRSGYVELVSNGYAFGTADYYIHRSADGQENIFGVSPPIQYNDFEIMEQTLSNPNVNYQLESLTEDSVQIISNPVTVVIKDDLKWPNAIIAGEISVDGTFRPFVQRSVPQRYNLKIFNKWGQLLFESNNIENGWNGTFNGRYVLPGGYLYIATYKFEDSNEKVKKGTVTVIH